jgi:hypothetical protein
VTSVKGAPERVLAMCDHELDPRTGQLLLLEQDRWDAAVEQRMHAGHASSSWRTMGHGHPAWRVSRPAEGLRLWRAPRSRA